jgi:hypothetical protein
MDSRSPVANLPRRKITPEWTTEDISFVRRLKLKGKTAAEIADALNERLPDGSPRISAEIVRKRGSRLGMVFEPPRSAHLGTSSLSSPSKS